MGAWGIGYFENDAALDFLDDIEEMKNPDLYFLDSINSALQTDFLDADHGCEIIVISALIDYVMNETVYEFLVEEYPNILNRVKTLKLNSLKDKALQALKVVLSNQSELNDLWLETNDEDYEAFKSEVLHLIERIETAGY